MLGVFRSGFNRTKEGKKMKDWLGDVVDLLALVGLVFTIYMLGAALQ